MMTNVPGNLIRLWNGPADGLWGSGAVYFDSTRTPEPGEAKADPFIEQFLANPKRRVKDSVLTTCASIPKYALEMYRELHPEDTQVKAEDIEIVTTTPVLVNGLYNDLGILVHRQYRHLRDLLMLFEFQTAWDATIARRMVLYMEHTRMALEEHAKMNNRLSEYLKNEPLPELYCLYPGPSKNRPSRMSYLRSIYGPECPDTPLDVQMLYSGPTEGGILDQMLRFSRIETAQRMRLRGAMEGRSAEEIARAIAVATYKECVELNVLADFLREHEQEVLNMMTTNQAIVLQYTRGIEMARETAREAAEAAARAAVEAAEAAEAAARSEIARKDKEIATKDEEIATKDEAIAALKAQDAKKDQRVAELEAQLARLMQQNKNTLGSQVQQEMTEV